MASRQERLAKLGLTEEIYDLMVEFQDNTCLICGDSPSDTRALAIDHDHANGAIRGLLCGRCNMGLGYFRDRVDLLQRAVKYLEHAANRYADCCRSCQKTNPADYDPRAALRLEPNGKGNIRAHYRCDRCGDTWSTGWSTWPIELLL